MHIIKKPVELLRRFRRTIGYNVLASVIFVTINPFVLSTNAQDNVRVNTNHRNPGNVTNTAANPFAGAKFFIDPNSNAKKQADTWRLQQRTVDAAQMDKIANQPQADWFASWNTDIQQDVNNRVTQITNAGALPVLVAYNIPKRDCGNYSSGGAISPEAYKNWITSFANGIGSRKAVVIIEPDALGLLNSQNCLSNADKEARLQLINYAVNTFKSQSRISVYIDAGHSNWISPQEIAERLKKAGIAKADGFSTNISNFMFVNDEIKYGQTLSKLVGGKRFIIDTSRNGNGPASGKDAWCNPYGRALGIRPTSQTGNNLVDAFFWIKRPGESDGTCNNGPQAGQWWAEYALSLARGE
ncbi:MAG: glycoside hydrolase family 6 protein [Scytonematopsis contorta HA4267-MV1]|jgi:endoglucanase|nr:glycoside hydrolase family 6 protein [Scytonematopsis contorta HA4267-MV1]